MNNIPGIPLIIRKGDTFTLQGIYARRTFWQWLIRSPRKLAVFRAGATE